MASLVHSSDPMRLVDTTACNSEELHSMRGLAPALDPALLICGRVGWVEGGEVGWLVGRSVGWLIGLVEWLDY